MSTDGASGEVGKRGVTGADGQRGAAGADGQRGTPGADGQRGIAGADGQRGAPGAVGPDGADGPDGVHGPEGPRGPGGAPGKDILSRGQTIAGFTFVVLAFALLAWRSEGQTDRIEREEDRQQQFVVEICETRPELAPLACEDRNLVE